MKYFYSFLILIATLSVNFAQSGHVHQGRTCGTMQALQEKFKTNPEYEKNYYEHQRKMAELAKNPPKRGLNQIITIPVVVHCVYKNATDSITMNDVLSQIDSMNKDFRLMNADKANIPAAFQSVAADFEMEFCLAKVDPDGNPTTGLTYTKTTVPSFSTNDDIKHSNTGGKDIWPADDYLNIWVGDLGGGLLGYAQFPGGPAAEDGVVIGYNCFGSQNPALLGTYNLGRTAPHEIGHWLGLRHIWGDSPGCSPDDNIADTPTADDANYGCQTYPFLSTCQAAAPGEMFMNYMDYGDDNCIIMFTNGQKQVSRALFDPGGDREALGQSAANVCNIVPPVPVPDAKLVQINFPANNDTLCSGKVSPIVVLSNVGKLTMTSAVIEYTIDGGTPVPFTWNGSLDSGDIATVTLPQSVVAAGSHTLIVTITLSNGSPDVPSANNSQTSIFVILNATGFPLPFSEGFEIGVFPQNNITLFNPNNNNTWALTDTAAALGLNSVVMNNFTNGLIGSVDELRLPTLDLTNALQVNLEFDYAYASFTQGSSDTLEVMISIDCGRTYQSLGKYFGSALTTAPSTTSSFVPNITQWKHKVISLTPYAGVSAAKVLLRNTSNNENNLYLDNLNVYAVATSGLETPLSQLVKVYPNPTENEVLLSYFAKQPTELSATLNDLTGKTVFSRQYPADEGTNQWQIPVNHLAKGIYLLTLKENNRYHTLKLMIQ